ncbi:MAG: hypothetical protein HAW62_05525 [Endozoicomonadaceae bacterium]|nr:hypothetical protein [Endozoicomonadaceae bacterium]
MNEDTVKKMALIVAANCLSQTDTPLAKASNAEQDKFNKQVVDRLYTFFVFLLSKPSNEYSALMTELTKLYKEKWPLPDLDHHFLTLSMKTQTNPPTSNHSI